MCKLLQLICLILPWALKRRALTAFFGYKIHPSARIGFSWFYPRRLEMGEGASVGHLNVAVNLFRIVMDAHSKIGRSNWITGFPKGNQTHFTHLPERDPSLYLGAHSAITKHHHIDCTERITIGSFVTIAGYQSQFLTHSINIHENRQDALPIEIGNYAFVGTNVIVLGGARLPERSVLGAKSLLNKTQTEPCSLYGGVPAKRISALPENAGYFQRSTGRVI